MDDDKFAEDVSSIANNLEMKERLAEDLLTIAGRNVELVFMANNDSRDVENLIARVIDERINHVRQDIFDYLRVLEKRTDQRFRSVILNLTK